MLQKLCVNLKPKFAHIWCPYIIIQLYRSILLIIFCGAASRSLENPYQKPQGIMTTMMSETMYSLCTAHLSGNITCWRTSTKLNSFNAAHLNIYTKQLFVIALNIMYIFTKWFFINCPNYKFCHKPLCVFLPNSSPQHTLYQQTASFSIHPNLSVINYTFNGIWFIN